MLKTIGIEKGKPFKPDEKTKTHPRRRGREAHAMIALKYETGFAAVLRRHALGLCRSRRKRRDGLSVTNSPTQTAMASTAAR